MPATSTQSLNKYNVGLTLIELMIAVAIGCLILSVILTIYLSSQKSLRLQLALNQIQNNTQKVHSIFKQSLERTGYLSCLSLAADMTLTYPPFILTPHHILSGSQHELIVRYVEYPGNLLLGPIQDQSVLSVDLNKRISPQDIMVISDCRHAEMFQVRSLVKDQYKQQIVTTKPLQHHYDNHAEVARFKVDHYFVKRTRRLSKDGSPIYALFIKNLDHTEELVEGIESMYIVFTTIKNGIWSQQSPSMEIDTTIVGVSIMLQLKSAQLNKISYLYFSIRRANAQP